MNLKKALIIFAFCLPFYSIAGDVTLFRITKGKVVFSSEAPLELIRASSDELAGILNINKGQFAFKISIRSFIGFNNDLQRDHFNENYMETEIYPFATYAGKIIENIDYRKNGVYKVRAKGKFIIHGMAQERIIPSEILIDNGKIAIKSDFTVLLSDYNIKIPRIVNNNLSKEIKVSVSAELMPQ